MIFKYILLSSLLMFSSIVSALPAAKITIKVIDQDGNPIEDAKTSLVLMEPKGAGEGWGTVSSLVSGMTDSEGMFTGAGDTDPNITFSATKDGYYGTGGTFRAFTGLSGIYGFRKYEPWNPTVELMLKKIINPIPMYAVNRGAPRKGELPVAPIIGRFVGYDLMENDWVVPHGIGTHRDFLFKVDIQRAVSNRDYAITLTLKFSNAGDGLIKYTPNISKGKSRLRLPYHVPISGYVDELVQHYESKPGEIEIGRSDNPDFDINYFFRVRTELDENGNVVGGLYGKIHGEIRIGNHVKIYETKPNINFSYYLNSNNNDTNIEFDTEKNLFKDVPDRLRITNP